MNFSRSHSSGSQSQKGSATSAKSKLIRASSLKINNDQKLIPGPDTPSPTNSTKSKNGSLRFDFSQRSKIIAEADQCAELIEIDRSDFVKKLKSLDMEHKDQLPMHIMWAWEQVDKNGTGRISPGDMARMELRYIEHVSTTGDIVTLIKQVDTDHNMDLDVSEIGVLLMLVGGRDVTLEDAQYVRAQLESMANIAVHGAYHHTMTTDPHLVSKAIFDWWWHYRGNKHKMSKYQPPSTTAPATLLAPPTQPQQVQD